MAKKAQPSPALRAAIQKAMPWDAEQLRRELADQTPHWFTWADLNRIVDAAAKEAKNG
jgi:Arc/MetJ family transcription regulator